ncbi:hypothetical protein [Amycolatopsis sp. cg9]|uniref:hypothetical protein n=1 Tax=Amycolatopsis sp. cg9 TaxID=3238801 RepID=UPI003525CF95
MKIVTTGERPDLKGDGMAPLRLGWPPFVLRDPISGTHRDAVQRYFPQFDVLLLENDSEVLGRATAVALRWDGSVPTLPSGYDGALIASVAEHENSVEPDTLCVVAATVRPDRTGAAWRERCSPSCATAPPKPGSSGSSCRCGRRSKRATR